MNPPSDRLEQLSRLLESGQLSPEEFELLRRRYLDELTTASETVAEFQIPPKQEPAFRSALVVGLGALSAALFLSGYLVGRSQRSPALAPVSAISPSIPNGPSPNEEANRQAVAILLREASGALEQKDYSLVMTDAKKIVAYQLTSDTQYRTLAQQLFDRAQELQKDKELPGLEQARDKFAKGDYLGSREICETMLKQDSSNLASQRCKEHAQKQLDRLAKESYTHGYILETMSRHAEAKRYFERAALYVRPGDAYYEKVQERVQRRAPSSVK